jgi:hypothetical protein
VIDLLVASTAFSVVVALLVVGAVLVTVVPVYVALGMAESRRFSTARWGAVAAVFVVAALAASYVMHNSDVPKLLPLLPLALAWGGPGLLWLLESDHVRIGGRAGQHE